MTSSPPREDGFWKSAFAYASFALLMGYFLGCFLSNVVVESLKMKWRTRDEVTAEAKILNLYQEEIRGGPRTHIFYEYSFGGKTYRCSSEEMPREVSRDYSVLSQRFQKGIPIRVYLDPEDPGYSVVDRSFHPLAVLIASVVILALGGATAGSCHALWCLVRDELCKLPSHYDENQYLVPELRWFDRILGQQRDPSVNWPEFQGVVPPFDLAGSGFGQLCLGDDVSKAGFLGKPDQMIWSRNGFYSLHYRRGGFELCFLDRKFHSVDFFLEPDQRCPAPLGTKFGPVTILHPDQGVVTLSAQTTETNLRELFGPPVATELEGRDTYAVYALGNLELEFEMNTRKRRPRTLVIQKKR